MRKKYLLALSGLVLFIFNTYSQTENTPIGAKAVGMAHASVTLQDGWSFFNNIAGLATMEGAGGGVFYENRFGLSELNTLSATFASQLGPGVAGAGVTRFGSGLYNETRAGAGYAHQIGFVSLGISADYIQVVVQDFDSKNTVAFHAGGIAKVTEELTFGAHAFNINQAQLAEYDRERLPAILKGGLAYEPTDKLTVIIETEKHSRHDASFKAGVDYKLMERLSLRTGISTKPFIGAFGVGFNHKNFFVDYALTNHIDLGFSHNISLYYKLFKKPTSGSTTPKTISDSEEQ